MANAFLEGDTWSIRPSINGVRRYLAGFPTAAAAREAAAEALLAIRRCGEPAHGGARKMSLAEALASYAAEEIVKHKGVRQEIQRVNKYLAAAGRTTLKCVAVTPDEPANAAADTRPVIQLEPRQTAAGIPNSLRAHRDRQSRRTSTSDQLRSQLARSTVSDITRHQLQSFFNQLHKEGLAPATIALERALLRTLFNHAYHIWNWLECQHNPAKGLKLPKVSNRRERVMSPQEEARIVEALQHEANPWLAPLVFLLVETAMRVSEPIVIARWDQVDFEAGLLTLGDSKTGGRRVPLSPRAVAILESLPRKASEPRIFRTTYEAIKAAWNRVCARAGVDNLHIHDLRHTAATRYALANGGNKYLVKALTGHKTDQMVERYIHIGADAVVADLRARDQRAASAAGAPMTAPAPQAVSTAPALGAVRTGSDAKVLVVDFRRGASR